MNASYVNLAGTLKDSGRREESLVAARRVVDLNDPSHLPLEPNSRLRASTSLLFVIEFRRDWEEQADALSLCRRVLPILEELVAKAPSNRNFRTSLVRAYSDAADIELDLGSYSQSAEDRRKGLAVNLEQPGSDAAFWGSAGNQTLLLATALELAGKKAEAEKSRRESLKLFNHSRDIASTAAGKTRNPAALNTLYLSNTFEAVAFEHLGDLHEALRFRKLALDAESAAAKEAPSNPSIANSAESALASWTRVSTLVEPGKPVDSDPRRARWLTARGIREWSWELHQITRQPHLELALKSVEMFRVLTAENRADSLRELGVSLQDLGRNLKLLARSEKGEEWASAMRRSREAFVESLQILKPLKTPVDAARPAQVMVEIATIDSKLASAGVTPNLANGSGSPR